MTNASIVALLNPIMSAIYCTSLFVLWWHYRHRRYIAIFALSYAVRALCFGALYFAFQQLIPMVRLAANMLVLVSMALLSVALSSRYRQRPRYGMLALIGIASLLSLYVYHFIEPSLLARALIINTAMALVCLLMLADVARRAQRTPVEQLFFWFALLSCAGFLLRPLALLDTNTPAEQVESLYWVVVAVSDALICSVIGLAVFGIIAIDIMAEIKVEAQTDALSGLLNRRGFDSRAQDALAAQTSNAPVTVVIADLDHFKSINDRFGHDSGDAIIRTFSNVLRRTAPADAIVGRQGGEEFAVLLPSGQADAAHRFAAQVQYAFKQFARNLPAGLCNPTASFGIAVAHAEDDLSTLMSRADKALYRAKSDGRNCARQA